MPKRLAGFFFLIDRLLFHQSYIFNAAAGSGICSISKYQIYINTFEICILSIKSTSFEFSYI